MGYKSIISEKDQNGIQYLIIKDDGSEFESNLNDNEIIINQLQTKDCPINRNCIDYIEESGLSRFCEHFVSLFQLTTEQFSFESLFCNQNKKYKEISELKPVHCPIDRNNCLNCKWLASLIAVPYPEKSNCHVVCDRT